MTNWTEELSDKHKEQLWEFIVETVKEIREQIAQDIEATNQLLKQNLLYLLFHGHLIQVQMQY